MHKIFYVFLFVFYINEPFAQINYDLKIDLLTPAYGDSLLTGAPFDMIFDLINSGPDTIPGGSIVHYRASIFGATLGNFTYTISPYLSPASSITATRSLSIGGGQSTTATFCVKITSVSGPAAGGELDTTNWSSCTQVEYKKINNVSTDDFYLMQPEDKSYVSGQTLFIDVEDIPQSSHLSYSLINIAGQTLLSGRVRVRNFSAKEEVQLPQFSSGIYILLTDNGEGFRNSKKVLVFSGK